MTSIESSSAVVARPVVDLTVAIVNYRSQALLERCLETWNIATEGLRAELCVL